jgi:hypothetical protein
MGKTMAWMTGAALALGMLGCDDGPVRKAVNCNRICEEVDECFGDDIDSSECKDSCNDDVDTDAAQECAECLRGDTCRECSVECAEVGIDMLFN